ncbi:MAG: sigma-70 family RNA polymerase sigma factor [Spirochaetaceae bacterium]|jgi:RNA polymerase sigma-70 factor (ECF subfamily)|nr:sigma-70 family RNA polymerase sigma factor [Spirochaetaceae bacterium]
MNQNNANWLNGVYIRFKDKVYGYFLKKLNSPELSEDLTSHVFLEITKNIDRFDETKSSESTWIYTICRNLCNRHLRDFYNRRYIEKKYEDLQIQAGESKSRDNNEIERLIAADTLHGALLCLNTDKKHIIILSYYYGLNPREIALRLGLSYTNVCVLKSRALRELRKILNGNSSTVKMNRPKKTLMHTVKNEGEA